MWFNWIFLKHSRVNLLITSDYPPGMKLGYFRMCAISWVEPQHVGRITSVAPVRPVLNSWLAQPWNQEWTIFSQFHPPTPRKKHLTFLTDLIWKVPPWLDNLFNAVIFPKVTLATLGFLSNLSLPTSFGPFLFLSVLRFLCDVLWLLCWLGWRLLWNSFWTSVRHS